MRFKFMMAVFFALAFMANMAFADTNDVAAMRSGNSSYSKNSGCQKEECQKYPSKCKCEDYLTCCPTLPLPAKCGYVTLGGEYLYWKTYTTVPYTIFRYAVTPFNIAGNDYTVNDAQVRTVDMNAHSGYRLNLGIYFSSCSNLLATYRQYQAHGTDGIAGAGTDTSIFVGDRSWVDPVWMTNAPKNGGFGSVDGLPVSANATQRHRENVLDLDFQRTFACSRFNYSPYVGVRFAWVKSDLRVDYFFGGSDSNNLGFRNHVDVANHMNLGVGLHTGINSNVDLGWGFGCYGKSGLAALIGQFQYAHREDVFDDSIGNVISYTTEREFKVTNFQTVWELGVGLNWGHHFGDCGYYLGFNIGYDVNVWPKFFSAIRTQALSHFVSNTIPHDIMSSWTRSLLNHGLTVGGRFDF